MKALIAVCGIASMIAIASCPSSHSAFVPPQSGPHGCAKGQYWISYNTEHCRSGDGLTQTIGLLEQVTGVNLCLAPTAPYLFGINVRGQIAIQMCFSIGIDPSKFPTLKGTYVDASLDSQARVVGLKKHAGPLPG